jgi:threonine/homoserine/homoserine lactone efflux protein
VQTVIDSSLLPSLVLFAMIATFSPGGATVLAVASGARFGFRRSLPLISGMALGVASHAAATAGGIGMLMLAAPWLQSSLRLAGSVYLLWLAWKIARAGAPDLTSDATAIPAGAFGGFMLIWLNPKVWAINLAAAAGYAALAGCPFVQALAMGSVFGLAATGSLFLWCAGGLILAKLLRTDAQWLLANAVLALLLALSIIQMWL